MSIAECHQESFYCLHCRYFIEEEQGTIKENEIMKFSGGLALSKSNLPIVPARPSGFCWLCTKNPRAFVYQSGSRVKRRSRSRGLCRTLALCGTYHGCCCGHSYRSGDNLKPSKRITPSAACRCLPLQTEAGPAQTAWSGWGICRLTVGVMTQPPSASRSHGPRAS